MISQVLFASEQPKKKKMAFVSILSQIKLLFGPLVIQLARYILKQLFTSVSVTVETLSDDHTAAPGNYNNRLSMKYVTSNDKNETFSVCLQLSV